MHRPQAAADGCRSARYVSVQLRKFPEGRGANEIVISEFKKRLNGIDKSELTSIVRSAQGNDAFEIDDWHYESLNKGSAHNFGGAYGLYRFSGHGQDSVQKERVSWSIILKAFGELSGTGSSNITTWNYWKREVLAYQSGWLADLPGGLTAPLCFGVTEYPNQEYWIWLEDLGSDADAVWPLERYGLVAQHLGQFNGAYLVGTNPIPTAPWFSKGRVREWLAMAAPVMAELDTLKAKPIVRQWLPGDTIDRLKQLWSMREPLLATLDKLPLCLCHHDASRLNLIARQGQDGQDETVAIDWAIMGTGVVGEELAAFVGVSLNVLAVGASDAQRLDTIAFAGYLTGLRDAGWQGDANLVRYGFAASMALYLNLAGSLILLKILYFDIDENEQRERIIQQATGHSLAAYMAQKVALNDFYSTIGSEALRLLEVLG